MKVQEIRPWALARWEVENEISPYNQTPRGSASSGAGGPADICQWAKRSDKENTVWTLNWCCEYTQCLVRICHHSSLHEAQVWIYAPCLTQETPSCEIIWCNFKLGAPQSCLLGSNEKSLWRDILMAQALKNFCRQSPATQIWALTLKSQDRLGNKSLLVKVGRNSTYKFRPQGFQM